MSDSIQVNWRGYFAGAVAPFTREGILDLEMVAPQAEFFIESGAKGILANGFTGGWYAMSSDERNRVAERFVEVVNGRVPVLTYVNAPSYTDTVGLVKHAESVGVAGVGITPPPAVEYTQRELINFYEAIAAETKLPILLYNIPTQVGNNLDTDLAVRLSEIPNIVAMKDSPVDKLQLYRTSAALQGRLKLFSAYMNPLGCTWLITSKLSHGYLGSAMILGRRMSDFFDCIWAEDFDGAVKISADLMDLEEKISTDRFGGYWTAVVAITSLQTGVDYGMRFPRSGALSGDAVSELKTMLDKAMLDKAEALR